MDSHINGLVSLSHLVLGLFVIGAGLLVFSAAGIILNTVNIVVFSKMTPKDSVTTMFLGLSASDLCMSCFVFLLVASIFVCPTVEGISALINGPMIKSLLITLSVTTATASSVITASMAVIRCLCVAKPLVFKDLSTPRKAVVIIMVSIALSSPSIILNIFLGKGNIRRLNTTALQAKTCHADITLVNKIAKDIVFAVTRFGFSSVIYAVLIISIIVLAWHLRKMSQFRKSVNQSGENQKPDSKLAPREVHVVMQVLLIAVVYVVTSLPLMLHTITSATEPSYDMGQRQGNMYLLGLYVGMLSLQINGCVNTWVYFNYNSKFRNVVMSLIRPGGK